MAWEIKAAFPAVPRQELPVPEPSQAGTARCSVQQVTLQNNGPPHGEAVGHPETLRARHCTGERREGDKR